MRPVLLLGHDVWETFGLAPRALGAAGVPVLVHPQREAARAVPSLEDVSGVVVFGGEMNVDQTGEYPFLAEERELVRRAVAEQVPFLGICLGAQMLARALDTPVYPAVKEIGFEPLHPVREAAGDPLLSVFRDGDMVFHWHEDTFDLPPGAVLLATGDRVRVQALRVGELAWGVQFHVEVDRPELAIWLADTEEGLQEAWGKSAEQIREEAARHLATQEERARELFRRFAEVVRAARG